MNKFNANFFTFYTVSSNISLSVFFETNFLCAVTLRQKLITHFPYGLCVIIKTFRYVCYCSAISNNSKLLAVYNIMLEVSTTYSTIV